MIFGKSVITGIIGFGAGLTVGAFIFKKKYQKIADEEIKSVIHTFKRDLKDISNISKKYEAEVKNQVLSEKDLKKPDILKYKDAVKDYTSLNGDEDGLAEYLKAINGDKKEVENNRPYYVIEPDEFGMLDDYEQIDCTYFLGDGVLTDDKGNVFEDDRIFNSEFVEYFKDGESVVLLRNDEKKCEYEIVYDPGNYLEQKEE